VGASRAVSPFRFFDFAPKFEQFFIQVVKIRRDRLIV